MAKVYNLSKELKKYFGFDTFKGHQKEIIENVLSGSDTFVLMPTGGGKSMCYQLPALLMDGTAIVISPLIALMKNQVDAIRQVCEEEGVAHFLNSSLNKASIDLVKSDIRLGKTKLLYVAPESLTKEENIEFLKTVKISFYAIDEAHCISEWGHDFRPEYRNIRPIINQIAFSGVLDTLKKQLGKQLDAVHKQFGDEDEKYVNFQTFYDESLSQILSIIRRNAFDNVLKKELCDCYSSVLLKDQTMIEACGIKKPSLMAEDKFASKVDSLVPVPVIALTATATDKVKGDIKKNLGMMNAAEFCSSFNRPNLYYEVRQKTKDVDRDIIRYIKQHSEESGIIYCLSRKKVEELAEVLQANDIKARAYHAGMDTQARSAAQDDFIMENINVIVATIAFGMGIDKPDVRFVIHYDIPKSLEEYYQETGRAGRDGGEGQCIAFYASKDLQKLEKFMEGRPVAEQEIGRQLLKETSAYAESSVCRRKMLLHYFGESYPKDNCGNCDNCLNPKKQMEAQDSLCVVIEAILAIKENFKAEYVIDFLLGRDVVEITSRKHEELEAFGSGEGEDEKYWNAVIRQALIAGYLVKDVENYGILHVSDKGRKFLENPKSFTITEDNDFDEVEEDAPVRSGASCAVDPTLYGMLKDLRKKLSKKLQVPPYVIFQDASLEAMATIYPVTAEELQNIPGVGAGKAKRYGKEFCELIHRHCEENEIERPEDFRVRTVANKSKLKVSIIQSIDLKVALDDIALSKGVEFSELLDDVEAIVYSGTKLNIDYFLDEVVDEDHVQDIYDYFRGSTTDDLETAMRQLGDEYSEDEIRLVRIKFISEMAN